MSRETKEFSHLCLEEVLFSTVIPIPKNILMIFFKYTFPIKKTLRFTPT